MTDNPNTILKCPVFWLGAKFWTHPKTGNNPLKPDLNNPPASKAIREVANFTERKNLHMVTKNLSVCMLLQTLIPIISGLAKQYMLTL